MAKRSRRGSLSAEAIADRAFAASGHLVPVPKVSHPEQRAEDPAAIARAAARAVLEESQQALDRFEPVLEAMEAVIAQSLEAKQTRNGRELTDFERDPAKFGRFVRALARGNYRETACRIAGIAPSSVRNWIAAAEAGDRRYQAVAHAIAVAEASAEDETIADVRAAGKDPRFWTAGMTWAERKFPDRWGRRQDDQSVPRVVVQIGVKDSDVRVSLSPSGESVAEVTAAIRASLTTGLTRDDAIARFGSVAGGIYDWLASQGTLQAAPESSQADQLKPVASTQSQHPAPRRHSASRGSDTARCRGDEEDEDQR